MADATWDLDTLRQDLEEAASMRTANRTSLMARLKQRRAFILEKMNEIIAQKKAFPSRSEELVAQQVEWSEISVEYDNRINTLSQWDVKDIDQDSDELKKQRKPFVFHIPGNRRRRNGDSDDDSDSEDDDANDDEQRESLLSQRSKRSRRSVSEPSSASKSSGNQRTKKRKQTWSEPTDDADIRTDICGRVKAIIKDSDADELLKQGYRVYSPRDYGPFEITSGTHTTHGHRLDNEQDRVFVKKVYGSDGDRECALLTLLNSQDLVADSTNHTVPLLSFVKRARATLLLFPDLVTLKDYVADHPVSRAIANDLMHQLKEGMEFMHKHKIAHFDLKPDNLLVDPKSLRLFITDFDLAEQFDRHDVEITGFRGNLEFTAPFVSDTFPYNPFDADRYSYDAIKVWIEKYVDRDTAQI